MPDDFEASLGSVSRRLDSVRDLLSLASYDELSSIDLPQELVTAWMHLIVCLASATADYDLFYGNAIKFEKLADTGIRLVLRRLTSRSLLDYAILMPLDIASLVGMNLLHDLTGPYKNISATYDEYLSTLVGLSVLALLQHLAKFTLQEANIDDNPLDREHQDTLTRLKRELSVIRETCRQQLCAFQFIYELSRGRKSISLKEINMEDESRSKGRSVFEEDYRGHSTTQATRHSSSRTATGYVGVGKINMTQISSSLSPTDPDGHRGLIVSECRAFVQKRLRDFDEMDQRVDDLKQEVRCDLSHQISPLPLQPYPLQ